MVVTGLRRRQRRPHRSNRNPLDHNSRCHPILTTNPRYRSRPLLLPRRSSRTSRNTPPHLRRPRARGTLPTILIRPNGTSRCHTRIHPTRRQHNTRLDRASLPYKARAILIRDPLRQRPALRPRWAARQRPPCRLARRAGATSPALTRRQRWLVRCSNTSSTRRRICIQLVATATAHSRSPAGPWLRAGRTCSPRLRKHPRPRERQEEAHTRIPINGLNPSIP